MKTLHVLVIVAAVIVVTGLAGSGISLANLSGIGKAMLIYANDYEDELPRAGGRNSSWTPPVWWPAPDSSLPYGVQSIAASAGRDDGKYCLLDCYKDGPGSVSLCWLDVCNMSTFIERVDLRGAAQTSQASSDDGKMEFPPITTITMPNPFGFWPISISF